MLLRHLLKHPKTHRLKPLTSIIYHLVTGEKLMSITNPLIKLDSIELDKICDETLKEYRPKEDSKEKNKDKNK